MASVPAVIESHLDVVRLWKDGKLLLGSSNLCGRYWNGSLWCFEDVHDAVNVEKCLTGVDTESGISDIRCLKDNLAAVALDSGCLELYRMDNNPAILTNLFSSCEHDSIISSISVSSDESKVVSSGYDKCVKIWDITTWATIYTFRPVHAGIVWQVSCSTTDPNIIISCGQDKKILILDLRLPKPATILNPFPLKHMPTAVVWKPQSNDVFAAGDESGYIVVKDIRNLGNVVHYEGHKRSIFKLTFSPVHTSWLASCCDSTEVTVVDVEQCTPRTIHHDDTHSDFVRGLEWNSNNALISCGWDRKVLKHNISSCEMDVVNQNNNKLN